MVRLAAPLALACLVSGCASTGVGNPRETTAELAITGDPKPEPDAEDAEPPLPDARVTHAILVVETLKWIACDSEEDSVTLIGPYVIDLVKNTVTPEIEQFTVPVGGFCGLDAKLGEAQAPASMAGRSILFSGNRSDDSRFILFASLSGTIRLRPKNSKPWMVMSEAQFLFAIRPHRWLSLRELDEAQVDPSTEGEPRTIAIDANRHPLLLSTIRQRIGRRSTLHLDLNGNGVVDDSERIGSAWIGTGLTELD